MKTVKINFKDEYPCDIIKEHVKSLKRAEINYLIHNKVQREILEFLKTKYNEIVDVECSYGLVEFDTSIQFQWGSKEAKDLLKRIVINDCFDELLKYDDFFVDELGYQNVRTDGFKSVNDVKKLFEGE